MNIVYSLFFSLIFKSETFELGKKFSEQTSTLEIPQLYHLKPFSKTVKFVLAETADGSCL